MSSPSAVPSPAFGAGASWSADASGDPEVILTNARVVLRDQDLPRATLVLRDGVIAAIDPGPASSVAGALDMDGALLLPGLIEMHTDNMEKHFEPRPGVIWPSPLAVVLAHDTQIVGAGITTVFDAISVGASPEKGFRGHLLAESLAAVKHALAAGVLRADHLFHLRCEVSDPCVVELIEPHLTDSLVRLVSVMDHTPGQRQWTDIASYIRYKRGENWSDDQIQTTLESLRAGQEKYALDHRRRIVDLVRPLGLPLASHDDATEAHVAEALAEGVTISEFPITLEAAQAARAGGMRIIMGAPNLVRGGSHSGNISAMELARAGLLDGLSSDYVPLSLVHAAFLLHETLGLGLPEAVAKVSANIADMLGLEDRGEIAPGKRADLIRVRPTDHVPVVEAVWRAGRRLF